jgi:hypothetical protein
MNVKSNIFEYSDTVTPMIQISCGGKNKYSTSKNDVGPASSVYWGEHIFFERNNVVSSFQN